MILSVVTQTHRRTKRLARALDSVINQLKESCEYEIIISDDSGTDSLVEQFVCENYGKDPHVKYFRNKTPLGSGFLNFAYAAKHYAKGEWVITLSDDDYFFDNSLKRLLRVIENNIDLEYIFLDCANDYGFGKVFDYDKELGGMLNIKSLCEYPTMELVFALKKELVEKLPTFSNGAFGSYLWTDYALAHCKNYYLPRFGYAYEVSGENFNKHKRYIKDFVLGLQLFSETREMLILHLDIEEILQICRARFLFFLNSASLIKGLYYNELIDVYERLEVALRRGESIGFLHEIAEHFEEKYQAKIEDKIAQLLVLESRYDVNLEKITKAKNVIIYGAGFMGRELAREYTRAGKNVVCFIDDFLSGNRVEGVEVFGLLRAPLLEVDVIVLASGRFDFLEKMKIKLLERGVYSEKIIGLV